MLSIGLTYPSAWAQPSEPTLADKETARQAFYEGQDAFNAGDLKGALKAFRAADAIMGLPSTRIEVGRTLAQMGKLLQAAEELASVDLIPAADDENDVQRDARAEAGGLLEKVRARIPTLQVEIRGVAPGTEIQLLIDGDTIPKGAQDYPRKVDPGRHVVRVNAPGYREVAQDVTVDEREKKAVRIELVASGGPVMPPPDPVEPTPDPGGGFEMPVWGWIGFGLGGAGLVVGGVTGVMTLSSVSDLEEACGANKECPPSEQSTIDDATPIAHVSTAGFVVGGVGIGVGVVAIIVGLASDEPDDSEAALLTPWVGPGSIGLNGRF